MSLLTTEVAKAAVGFVLPAIQMMMESGVLKRHDLHIVVARPFAHDGINMNAPWCFEEYILHEHSIGDPEKWEFPFNQIARSKCRISWRTGMSTQDVHTKAPHLLQSGDTVYYGSAVSDGLVVACSGVQPFFDQMIASWVLEACRAICIESVQKWRHVPLTVPRTFRD